MAQRLLATITGIARVAKITLATLLSVPAAVRAQAPGAPPAVPAVPGWQGKLAPCPLPDGKGEALCGIYEVFENREARSGRKIPLKIVLLPATGPDRAPDPVFLLSGGPGQGETMPATPSTPWSSSPATARPSRPATPPSRTFKKRSRPCSTGSPGSRSGSR